MTRQALAIAAIALLALTLPADGQAPPGISLPGTSSESMAALARGEWPTYAGTYASAKYSPLDQITPANVADLKVAWRWTSPDHAVRAANTRIDPSWYHEGTPIMVSGVLERDHRGVTCEHDDALVLTVAPVRNAAVEPAVVGRHPELPRLWIEDPLRPAGRRVDRRHLRQGRARVEHAVDHDRRALVYQLGSIRVLAARTC